MKAHYHIDEVVEIFQKTDPTVNRRSVLELGERGLLSIGLLSFPCKRHGENDLWNQDIAKSKGYEIHYSDPFFCRGFIKSYKHIARALFDGLKALVEDAKKEADIKCYENVKDQPGCLLEQYKATAPIVKNYDLKYQAIIFFDIEDKRFIDTSYEPFIQEIGLWREPERLIFPIANYEHQGHWISRLLHSNIEYFSCHAFTDLADNTLIPVKSVSIELPCDELPEELCWQSEDSGLCRIELIYQHALDTDYFKRLIEDGRLYISRRELMRFEQQHLGINHGLDLSKKEELQQEKPSSPTDVAAKDTALKVIGLLMHYLADEKPNLFKDKGVPNKTGIRNKLLELASTHNVNDRGLKKAEQRILLEAERHLKKIKE